MHRGIVVFCHSLELEIHLYSLPIIKKFFCCILIFFFVSWHKSVRRECTYPFSLPLLSFCHLDLHITIPLHLWHCVRVVHGLIKNHRILLLLPFHSFMWKHMHYTSKCIPHWLSEFLFKCMCHTYWRWTAVSPPEISSASLLTKLLTFPNIAVQGWTREGWCKTNPSFHRHVDIWFQ